MMTMPKTLVEFVLLKSSSKHFVHNHSLDGIGENDIELACLEEDTAR
jgi:hypothetical protein